jgi:hypothetical protein
MACEEIAALRLGLMKMIGIDDEAERRHELAELGKHFDEPGPIRAMCDAPNFEALKRSYDSALALLEEKVSAATPADANLPYLRTLLVVTKKLEFDLSNHVDSMKRFYRDLDQLHDFIHEIYPAK